MRWLGAILPLLMTLTVVAAGVVHTIQVGGFVREADEGTAAHLVQILMPAQIPIIAVFAATQLPLRPRWAGWILALADRPGGGVVRRGVLAPALTTPVAPEVSA